MRGFALSALLAPLGLACSFAAESTDAPARVWMHHRYWPALVEDEAGWEHLRTELDGIKFSIDRLKLGSTDQLRRLGELMRENGIVSAVECGGLLNMQPMDDTIGERTAEVELAKLSALKEAGVTLDYLHLDGPIRRTLNDPQRHGGATLDSLDMAVSELIDYMRLVREEHPSVKFAFGSNFPNWGYKGGPSYTQIMGIPEGWGDYFEVLKAVVEGTRAAGIPVMGVMIDNPYDYAIGESPAKWKGTPEFAGVDWLGRILDLERESRAMGLEVGIIFNSQRGGKASGNLFCSEALQFLREYHAIGGAPDVYVIQSWYEYPKSVTPETQPGTMTHLVKAAIEALK